MVHDIAYCQQRGIDNVYNDFARAFSRISRLFIVSRSWILGWWHNLQRAGLPHFEEPGCFHCCRWIQKKCSSFVLFEKASNKIFELRFKSFIMLHLVELQISVAISKDHNAFFIRVSCSCKGPANPFSFLEHEDKNLTFLINVTNCVTVDMT